MKKLFVALMLLTGLGVQAFASSDTFEARLHTIVAEAQAKSQAQDQAKAKSQAKAQAQLTYEESVSAVLDRAASDESQKAASRILADFQRLRQNWATLTTFGENEMRTMYFEAESIMEKHLQLKETDLPLAEALCPFLNEPVQTGFGVSSMYNILFNHAVEMNPGSSEMQEMTEDYAKWLSGSK